jgi:DNA polymerase-3 subunit delta
MTELNYKSLDDHLKKLDTACDNKNDDRRRPPAAVYLIYGEEMLCKTALKKVLNRLVPESNQSFNFEPIDGNLGCVSEAVEKLNTYSLLSGPKVVGLFEARVLDSRTNTDDILLTAVKAFEDQNLNRAAEYLLRFMALANFSFDDLSPPNRRENLPAGVELPDDDRWLDDVIGFCQENGRKIPKAADNESILCHAIEKGFPGGNRLLITTDTVDKRRKLFKTIRSKGVIVDCSVPKGDRKADKTAQDTVLADTVRSVLSESGKSLAPDAFAALRETTGFELRAFAKNLEKLVSYIGDRDLITRQDVVTALKRTKKDPVYALTGAFTARNRDDALFYMRTLMSEGQGGLRPEQILVALLNQLRKLLLIKSFVSSPEGKAWHSGCPYHTFRTNVMPVVQKCDSELLGTLQQWQDDLNISVNDEVKPVKKRSRGKKPALKTDLLIARYPNNPYPIYQLFLNAENFSKQDLLQIYDDLSRADLRIKSGGENKRLILEEVILNVCRPKD